MAGITLKDVSREAGVSVALASSVLNRANGRIRASRETAQKIQETAARLGYVANTTARGLKMSRSFLIGVAAYAIDTSFVPAILEGAESFFLQNDYGMLLGSYNTMDKLAVHLESFRRRNIDGLIIISGRTTGLEEILKPFEAIPKAMVASDYQLPNSIFVMTEPESIAKIAVEEFVRRGHCHIAYMTNNGHNKVEMWRKHLLLNGIEPAPSLEVHIHNWFDEGYAAAEKLLRANPHVTAVFADSDIVGAAVLRVSQKLNRKVAVIGVDDSLFCPMLSPELASIAIPKREHGILAAQQLDLLLQGKKAENIVLKPEFKHRASVDI